MHRVRNLALVMTLAVVVSCADAFGPTDVVGRWELTQVNGDPVPGTVTFYLNPDQSSSQPWTFGADASADSPVPVYDLHADFSYDLYWAHSAERVEGGEWEVVSSDQRTILVDGFIWSVASVRAVGSDASGNVFVFERQ